MAVVIGTLTALLAELTAVTFNGVGVGVGADVPVVKFRLPIYVHGTVTD
jgi:hypothetical protein